MGFCNTYIPQSPRWPHEQRAFENHCNSLWVTPPQREPSEHQLYQLHANLGKAWKGDAAAACAGVTPAVTSARSRRERAGASHPWCLPRPAGLPRLPQGPSTSPLPSSPLSTVRFQLHFNLQKIQGSRKCFIMETWRLTYLLALLHIPKLLFLWKKNLLCWLTWVSLSFRIWCYCTCRDS